MPRQMGEGFLLDEAEPLERPQRENEPTRKGSVTDRKRDLARKREADRWCEAMHNYLSVLLTREATTVISCEDRFAEREVRHFICKFSFYTIGPNGITRMVN